MPGHEQRDVAAGVGLRCPAPARLALRSSSTAPLELVLDVLVARDLERHAGRRRGRRAGRRRSSAEPESYAFLTWSCSSSSLGKSLDA